MREIYLLNTRLVGLIDKVYKLVVRLLLRKDNNIDFDTIYI
jgi:hypothetical protein